MKSVLPNETLPFVTPLPAEGRRNKHKFVDPAKSFEKTIHDLSYRTDRWRIFRDFCEMSAMSLSNSVFKDEKREARYLEIAKRYNKEELALMSSLLADTALGLSDIDCDFLGERFMNLELSSHWKGQFFTPFCVSKLMAGMTVGNAGDIIKEQGFITICEPASGAGAMIIAVASYFRDQGINFQEVMHVTAMDLDSAAADMTFIQLSLLNIPALVYTGDTLKMEFHQTLATPAHHLGSWNARLSAKNRKVENIASGRPEPLLKVSTPARGIAPAVPDTKPGQLAFDFERLAS